MTTVASPDRGALLVTARRLGVFTIVWNVAEGAIAVTAGVMAGSGALLGFGLDSGIESISAAVLVWRIQVERRRPERTEHVELVASRLIGLSFLVLAAYVAVDAAISLWSRDRPDASIVGIVLTLVSLVLMPLLARRKRVVAAGLSSAAARADSAQTMACFWLSVVVLGGLILNAVAGWWWADPVAAVGVAVFLAVEGRNTLANRHLDDCC